MELWKKQINNCSTLILGMIREKEVMSKRTAFNTSTTCLQKLVSRN